MIFLIHSADQDDMEVLNLENNADNTLQLLISWTYSRIHGKFDPKWTIRRPEVDRKGRASRPEVNWSRTVNIDIRDI